MSPINSHRRFQEACLTLLWNQWRAMGMAHRGPRMSKLVLDPEATLLLTWSVGRSDPRVFDTGLAWCKQHGDLIDVSRLKALLRTADAETISVGAAWASHVAQAHSAWARLSRSSGDSDRDPQPLFLDEDGKPMVMFGATDSRFQEYGWERGTLADPEGALAQPSMSGMNLRFRLRKLLGVGARPEVIAILLMRKRSHSADLARISGYSKRTIQLVVSDLHGAGVVQWDRRRGRTNKISLRCDVWKEFLESAPYDSASGVALDDVQWCDTPQVFGGLIQTWQATRKLIPKHLSTHARATLINDAIQTLFTTAEWVRREQLPRPVTVGQTEQPLLETFDQLSADVFGEL